MKPKKLSFPDSIRLLKKRRDIESEFDDASLTMSSSAFFAWKAFIAVARGVGTAGRELEQCQQLVAHVLAQYPEMQRYLIPFAKALQALNAGSSAAMRDWYCDPEAPEDDKARRVESARRRIKATCHSVLGDGSIDVTTFYDVGQDIYAIRSAVIAHASVTTGGNVYDAVVTSFSNLLAVLTCGGIAIRSGVDPAVVMREANVS
jgi:hypothetical protein